MKWPYLAVTIAYCALIYWLSSGPVPGGIDLSVFGRDKMAHMAAFGILAAWVAYGIRRSNETVLPAVQFWVPLLFATAYGLFDEVHQAWVPEREFDWYDALFDAIGALLAQTIMCRGLWRIPLTTCITGQRAEAGA